MRPLNLAPVAGRPGVFNNSGVIYDFSAVKNTILQQRMVSAVDVLYDSALDANSGAGELLRGVHSSESRTIKFFSDESEAKSGFNIPRSTMPNVAGEALFKTRGFFGTSENSFDSDPANRSDLRIWLNPDQGNGTFVDVVHNTWHELTQDRKSVV